MSNLRPRICHICKNLSFLRCFDCDTVYCSPQCKMRDWEDHEKRDEQKRRAKPANNRKETETVKLVKKTITKAPISLKQRLLNAAQKDARVNVVSDKAGVDVENERTEQLMMNFSRTMDVTATNNYKALRWDSDEE